MFVCDFKLFPEVFEGFAGGNGRKNANLAAHHSSIHGLITGNPGTNDAAAQHIIGKISQLSALLEEL